jgi:hypothetical protein
MHRLDLTYMFVCDLDLMLREECSVKYVQNRPDLHVCDLNAKGVNAPNAQNRCDLMCKRGERTENKANQLISPQF